MSQEHGAVPSQIASQARQLMVRCGRGQPNWLNWQLHSEYLELPAEQRLSLSFHQYVIRELSND